MKRIVSSFIFCLSVFVVNLRSESYDKIKEAIESKVEIDEVKSLINTYLSDQINQINIDELFKLFVKKGCLEYCQHVIETKNQQPKFHKKKGMERLGRIVLHKMSTSSSQLSEEEKTRYRVMFNWLLQEENSANMNFNDEDVLHCIIALMYLQDVDKVFQLKQSTLSKKFKTFSTERYQVYFSEEKTLRETIEAVSATTSYAPLDEYFKKPKRNFGKMAIPVIAGVVIVPIIGTGIAVAVSPKLRKKVVARWKKLFNKKENEFEMVELGPDGIQELEKKFEIVGLSE